jgi:hypothetical protein
MLQRGPDQPGLQVHVPGAESHAPFSQPGRHIAKRIELKQKSNRQIIHTNVTLSTHPAVVTVAHIRLATVSVDASAQANCCIDQKTTDGRPCKQTNAAIGFTPSCIARALAWGGTSAVLAPLMADT